MKSIIESNNLANILFEIGYDFYKGINGVYYHFDLRKNNNYYEVYIIRPDNKELIMFKLNPKMKIVNINGFIKRHFKLPKGKINIKDWETYIVGGVREYEN